MNPPINDGLTRVQRYRQANIADGLCGQCPRKLAKGHSSLCVQHRNKFNASKRAKRAK